MAVPFISRATLALKGYLVLRRSWHCAWVMAAAPRMSESRHAPSPGRIIPPKRDH